METQGKKLFDVSSEGLNEGRMAARRKLLAACFRILFQLIVLDG